MTNTHTHHREEGKGEEMSAKRSFEATLTREGVCVKCHLLAVKRGPTKSVCLNVVSFLYVR